MSSLVARLKKLESFRKARGQSVYLFTIDDGQPFETEEALQEELRNPKYAGCTILIEDLKEMRRVAAEYKKGRQ